MRYDPFDSAIVDDPYPVYDWLREDAPVHFAPDTGTFVLSRYDDVLWAIGDTDLFSSDAMRGVLMGQPTGSGEERLPRDTPGASLVSVDPPAHHDLRRIVSRGFTPKRIGAWDDRIAVLVDALVSDARGEETFDIVDALAAPLPVQVITLLLGADIAQAAQFRAWADATTKMMSGSARNGDMDPAGLSAAMEMVAYLTDYIDRRQQDPGDDLISVLLQARDDGALTSAEAVGFAALLLFAGTETTTNLIGNAVWALGEHRDQLEAVLADRSLLPALVEEALRWESPVQYVFRRATRPFTRHGVDVPVDSTVTLLIGAANRDPRKFGDAAGAFDIRRGDGRALSSHLAFGFGAHFCLGAALARSEALAALGAVLPSVASAKVEGGDGLIDSMQFRGRRSLRLVS